LSRRTAQPKPPVAPVNGEDAHAAEARADPSVAAKKPRRPAKPRKPETAEPPPQQQQQQQPKPRATLAPTIAPVRARAPRPRTLNVPLPSPSSAPATGPGAAEPAPPQVAPQPTVRGRKSAHIAPAGALPPARIPPEALASPDNRKLLSYTFAISVAIHLIVLAIHFSPVDLRKFIDKGPPLEVALVNAKTQAKPAKAEILAQANLDGGGNTDQNRRAKTPLPVMKESPTNEVTIASQKVQALEEQTKELLAQLKSTPMAPARPQPLEAPDKTEAPTANDMMQRTLEAIRLEAQIAKDMDAYQKRPKRKFIGSRAEEYRFARYVEDWRLKVERIGNMNYPEAARKNKLYGSLLLTVSIKADGSLEGVEVNRSSGQRILDAAAVKIVEMGAPYSPFPPDIRRDTDIVHITRTWTFAKGDELRSE
jgi:protein TonB